MSSTEQLISIEEAKILVEKNQTNPHQDVIKRIRKMIIQQQTPRKSNGFVIQICQSEFKMVHSLFISRDIVLLFVTDLCFVENEISLDFEIQLLSYWIQYAYILQPDTPASSIIDVGEKTYL